MQTATLAVVPEISELHQRGDVKAGGEEAAATGPFMDVPLTRNTPRTPAMRKATQLESGKHAPQSECDSTAQLLR